MTFNPGSARAILKIIEHAQLPDKDLAIDFGSQRYTAQTAYPVNTVQEFWGHNGFKDYKSIDVNDACEFKADLNEILPMSNVASLITNIGTGEHIFDQCSVFTNMHNLCRVGGVMFFHLPFTPWLNHGFYNYNPILFAALAYANKYDQLMLEIGDREAEMLKLPYEEIIKEKGQHLLEAEAKKATKPLFVFCALKKMIDAPFKKPFQGKYRGDIADEQLLQRYL